MWSGLELFLLALVMLCVQGENGHQQNSTKVHSKRSYVCPPKFVRLSYKCYYFSKEPATWQDAYWKCHDKRSNLAVIKNGNQDKILRRTLSKNTVEPLERWLGGRYDWEQMMWKWAVSGKPVQYRGFDEMDESDKERLRWQCIILDPELEYKWNSRSCVDKFHYICQTKLKTVSRKGKTKLQKKYNATKYNQLNEVPVPVLQDLNNRIDDDNFKKHLEISNGLYDNNLLDNAAFGTRAKPARVKKHKKESETQEDGPKKGHKRRLRKQKLEEPSFEEAKASNATGDSSKHKHRKNRKYDGMKWKSYYDRSTISPLHPRRIIQEFTYL